MEIAVSINNETCDLIGARIGCINKVAARKSQAPAPFTHDGRAGKVDVVAFSTTLVGRPILTAVDTER